ncbi:integrin alpha [Nitrosomonas ureae]|uniref:FG-GAP repeat-containing protein n=1 Tax=Nitrosomonas ureae TaxID=44577 RepID=A0A1H5TB44_9PROT|nr:integrin alpha [Nitrosomonas ureae]SEF60010.1 FG-GAP repeat-containing protein [Nitrosomonas ureae]
MVTKSINLPSLDGSNGFRLDGVAAGDISGFSVSSAGDINGDGFDDLIIGAPGADPIPEYSSGSSYIVFGKASGFSNQINLSSLDGNNGFRLDGIIGSGYATHSGSSVSSAGDINGDGFDDLIIGSPGFNKHYSAGYAFIVFGQESGFSATMALSDLNGEDGFRIQGAGSMRLGASVSGGGDINGDGIDDVFVGAQGAIYHSDGAGYVVYGSTDGFSPILSFSDISGDTGFDIQEGDFSVVRYPGVSVSLVGDINGDGYDDVVIGALLSGFEDTERQGDSFVVFGKASQSDTVELSGLDGDNGFRLTGGEVRIVNSAGDVNGDGLEDFTAGSYVVFGQTAPFDPTLDVSKLDGSNGFHLQGSQGGGRSTPLRSIDHKEIGKAGDVNGDGYGDLIVRGVDTSGNGASISYVVFGKAQFDATLDLSNLDTTMGFRLDGVTAAEGEIGTVSGAGDINGDGFDDLIVGAAAAAPNGEDSGSSYVVFGGDFTHSVTFHGDSEDDDFTGTKAAESFVAGEGNDRMIGRGGADVFHGGPGKDYIRIGDPNFRLVDGGAGNDILGLAGSGFNLDLSSVRGKIHGIETIGLYGVGDNTLTLTALDVLNLSDSTNTLKIKGNTGDSVVGLSSGWTDGGIRGNFHEYTQGEAVILVGVNVATDFPVI